MRPKANAPTLICSREMAACRGTARVAFRKRLRPCRSELARDPVIRLTPNGTSNTALLNPRQHFTACRSGLVHEPLIHLIPLHKDAHHA
ncbi:hypothetical protein GCM10009304_26150 [Pseudomonas matsuisoli]|uniref:Uncharacterized protein n=1 Tax=Pseudomonas matsuisoli TaxID=1515666 RepID=A0A917PY54_9PSED|nr:hypothetical protein GCM10009304_26150 [Pseudomonas matsuisoli]